MADNNINVKTGAKPDPFLEELQGRLLDQADIVSSGQTGLEEKISGVVSGIEKGREVGAARTEATFGRQIEERRELGAAQITTAREAQRGFGVNTAQLKQLQQDTEKSLKDLEERRNLALQEGDQAASQQIRELELSALQFQQKAEQQTFQNTLATAGFQLQQRTEQRLTEQFQSNLAFQKQTQDFKKRETIAGIAAEFGVEIDEGETLESIVNKAAPIASAIKRAQLTKDLKEAQDEERTFTLDSTLTESILAKQSPEQAAMNALNTLTATTGIEGDADDLERLKQRAIVILNEVNAQKAESEARETTTGTSFMTSFVNALTGQSEDVRETQEAIRKQERTLEGLERFGASENAIAVANKKLVELEISLGRAREQQAGKEDSGSFFGELFGTN